MIRKAVLSIRRMAEAGLILQRISPLRDFRIRRVIRRLFPRRMRSKRLMKLPPAG